MLRGMWRSWRKRRASSDNLAAFYREASQIFADSDMRRRLETEQAVGLAATLASSGHLRETVTRFLYSEDYRLQLGRESGTNCDPKESLWLKDFLNGANPAWVREIMNPGNPESLPEAAIRMLDNEMLLPGFYFFQRYGTSDYNAPDFQDERRRIELEDLARRRASQPERMTGVVQEGGQSLSYVIFYCESCRHACDWPTTEYHKSRQSFFLCHHCQTLGFEGWLEEEFMPAFWRTYPDWPRG